jgi:hypothetical protein
LDNSRGKPPICARVLADDCLIGNYNCAEAHRKPFLLSRVWPSMSPHLFTFLESVGDYVTWQNRFAAVEGFLHNLGSPGASG